MPRWQLTAFAVVLAVLGAGCSSSPELVAVTSSAGETAKAPLVLQQAAGKSIITFDGLVNGGKPLGADLASFDALPAQRLTILEPFVKKTMTFTGVGFGDLLTAAKSTGKSVKIHALDDFEATLDVAALSETGVLLATRVDGKVIDLKSGGPVRLVFPPSSQVGKDTNLWVWSIDKITVR